MKTNRIRQNFLPLLTALIWGTAFVAQSVGAGYLGPFAFNAARAIIAFSFLLALCALLRLARRGKQAPRPASYWRDLAAGALCCGTALSVASYFQQKGLEDTTAGKAGFITALYIVLVPIFGIFLKKKAPKIIWLGVALAGTAGALLTQFYTIFPTAGASFGFRALIVVVVGGLGSIPGAFLAGIFLGLLETMSALFISPSYSDLIVFMTFIVILVVRQTVIARRK